METVADLTATDAENGGSLSVPAGSTLAVQLHANPTTGYSWHTVLASGGPFRLIEDEYSPEEHAPGMLGGGGVHTFHFAVGETTGAGVRGWLRLVLLRPFSPGLDGAKRYEIQVSVT